MSSARYHRLAPTSSRSPSPSSRRMDPEQTKSNLRPSRFYQLRHRLWTSIYRHPLWSTLAFFVLVVILLIPRFVIHSNKNNTRVVDLGYARYQGQSLRNGITQTLGIRYGAPPIGNLRFAAPQDPEKISGVQRATQHGKRCMGTSAGRVAPGTSEDCLFLDVYAPSNATSTSALPVYFWIQGGGFNANTNANYNGAGLIEASDYNIVVVTFNYRVGPYGFLASKEVEAEGSLNNGLKDQIKALQWVQKNIAQFGGDPDHVVIGGDSAGAASVTLLMGAYGGRNDGLFHAAAAESQSFAAVMNVTESQPMYDALVQRNNCTHSIHKSTLSCLRSLPDWVIQSHNFATPFPGSPHPPLFPYNPTLDHDLIPDLTVTLFKTGRYIRVPSIFGDVTDEGTIFTPKNTSSANESSEFLLSQFPALTKYQLAHINTIYPNDGPRFPFSGPYWRQVSKAYGELRYICPGLFVSRTLAADNTTEVPIWNYRFDVQDPRQMARGLGVPHISDVYAIWGPANTHGGGPSSLKARNKAIIPVIQGYWTSFIRTFDPNTYRVPGSPRWEMFNGQVQGRLLFQTNQTRMESVPEEQRSRCAYFDSISEAIQQ